MAETSFVTEQREALRRHNASVVRQMKGTGMTIKEIAAELQVSEAGLRELLSNKSKTKEKN